MEKETFLTQLEAVLTHSLPPLNPSYTLLSDACTHLAHTQKAGRSRPLFVLYTAQLFGSPYKESLIFSAASCVELIHTASLLHDDVVDAGATRRGVKTVNAQYGNCVAVLGGNFLLSSALNALRPFHPNALWYAIEAMTHMTKAAILEIQFQNQLEVSLTSSKEVALGKTGALFGLCGQLAGLALNQPETVIHRLKTLGEHVGVIFQMADDLRDFWKQGTYKDRFSDLKNKEPSLPILLAIHQDENLKQTVKNLWEMKTFSQADLEYVGQQILSTPVLEKLKNLMETEMEQVFICLKPYESSQGAQAIGKWIHQLYDQSFLQKDMY